MCARDISSSQSTCKTSKNSEKSRGKTEDEQATTFLPMKISPKARIKYGGLSGVHIKRTSEEEKLFKSFQQGKQSLYFIGLAYNSKSK